MHFDIVDMRLMVNVAEANNLTRGAEASHLSLPAASTRVKHLEESIGAKLLYRTSQGVTLTPPGQAFVLHARQVLSQLEHLRGDLQEYARGIKGHLRLQANTTALSEYLPTVLHAYLKAHPDVNIDLRERLSPDIVRAVSEGRADIGIVAGNVRTENLEVTPYRRDRLVLVVPAGHPLAGANGIDFRSTTEYNHVGLHESSAIHGFLQQVCREQGIQLRLRIQVGGFDVACRLVEAGVGIGVMPGATAARLSAKLAIAIVPLLDAWALRELKVCVRSLVDLPPFAQDLVQQLSAEVS